MSQQSSRKSVAKFKLMSRSTFPVAPWSLTSLSATLPLSRTQTIFVSARIGESVVHGLRTVVTELGAHRGFLISRNGFQSGAIEAATFTNIDLLSWRQFEQLIFDRWIDGVTKQLNPLFVAAHELMDPNNDELWNLRKCTEQSHDEWWKICQRYPLVTLWALFHWHSRVGLRAIPSYHLTDEGALSNNGGVVTLDTYRKIIDASPQICLSARATLEKFWGIR